MQSFALCLPSSEFAAIVAIGIPKRELVGQHFKKRLEVTRCPAVSKGGKSVWAISGLIHSYA
jgi:hypothetical protein